MQAVFKLIKYLKPYMIFAVIAPIMMLFEVGDGLSATDDFTAYY